MKQYQKPDTAYLQTTNQSRREAQQDLLPQIFVLTATVFPTQRAISVEYNAPIVKFIVHAFSVSSIAA